MHACKVARLARLDSFVLICTSSAQQGHGMKVLSCNLTSVQTSAQSCCLEHHNHEETGTNHIPMVYNVFERSGLKNKVKHRIVEGL